MFLQEHMLSHFLFVCLSIRVLMHVPCIYEKRHTSFRPAFIPQGICWHRHCVISAVRRRRCEDVVGDIHYKPAHQPIKAPLCVGDQARGRLRLSTETPAVCSSSWFPLFFCCRVLEHLNRRPAQSEPKLLLNFSLHKPKDFQPSKLCSIYTDISKRDT